MPSKSDLPEAEWNFSKFYNSNKKDFRKLIYYYEFGREYYIRGHKKDEKHLDKVIKSKSKKSWITDLLKYDEAIKIKTLASKFIKELAGYVDVELHGKPKGEFLFPAFRKNPFCALSSSLQNNLLRIFKRNMELLTKDRFFLLNHGFHIPSPDIRNKNKVTDKAYRKKWKYLTNQILNENEEYYIWIISKIDLRYNDRIIESQLKDVHDRLKQVRKSRKVKVSNKRRLGKKNYTSNLKNLAANRALAHYGDFQTAKEKTWSFNKIGENTPIYVRKDDWIDASEVVDSVLIELFF